MLERELTLQEGIIQQNLPQGVTWLRLGDTGKVTRNKLGCDGFLFHGQSCWVVEVKLNNEQLTDNERKLQKWCFSKGIKYVIIRYFTDAKLWIIEITNNNWICNGISLNACVEELIDY